MKNRTTMLGVILAIAPFALPAQTTPPPAAAGTTPADETVQLPAFTVSDQHADPYRATDSLSAARIRGALVDTPATINVVTSDFLQAISANSILDATQYLAGVSPGRLSGTNGIADRTLLRGFESSGRTIDNISTSYQGQVNPELIERVEVVKGPNAILAPTGSPGGALNIITKSPKFTESNEAILEVGRYYADKFTIDSTGPLSLVKGLAYRFVGSYQDAKTFVPKNQKSWDINPSILYRISENSQLTFKFTHSDWGAHGAAASPTSGLYLGPRAANGVTASLDMLVPGFNQANGGNLFPSWASREDRITAGTVELTTALSQNINMRAAISSNKDDFEENDVYASYGNGGGSFYDPYTGVFTPTQSWSLSSSGAYVPTYVAWPDASAVSVSPDRAISHYTDTSYQNDFAGHFETGGVSISPVAGWLYRVRHGSDWEHERPGTVQNLLTPRTEIANLDSSTYTIVDSDQTQSQKTLQAYAYTKLGFLNDRLFVTGGTARIKVDNWVVDHTSNDARSTLTGSHETYQAGVLGKLTKNTSIYYSYSTNAQATSAGAGAPPRWQDGKQHEVGVKAEFFDQRLGVSIAHFNIAQTNIGTPNPYRYNPVTGLPDPSQPATLYQDQKNNGLEFEVTGGLTKDLSVIASYTNMHLRDTLGRRVRNVPDESANLMLSYRFIKNASVSVGLLHTGDTAGETAPSSLTALGVVKQVSFYVAPHTLTSVGATYTWEKCTFALHVDNVTNEKGLWQASGRGGLQELTPINVKATVRYRF